MLIIKNNITTIHTVPIKFNIVNSSLKLKNPIT